MSINEFELKFIPTKACLEARLSQELSTNADYIFTYFLKEEDIKEEDIEEEDKAIATKANFRNGAFIWETSSEDFLKLQIGNSLASKINFAGFPEKKPKDTNSPQDSKKEETSTISEYILWQLKTDSFQDRSIPDDAYGILLSAGTHAVYAGEVEPKVIDMWPTTESFTTAEAIFWSSVYLGAFASEPQILESVLNGTDDLGFLNLENSNIWPLATSEIALIDISTNVTFDNTGIISFEDVVLEKSDSKPSVLGGVFISNGTMPDDLILYASPFYSDRQVKNVVVENALTISAQVFTDIVII